MDVEKNQPEKPLVFVLESTKQFGSKLLETAVEDEFNGKIHVGEVYERRFPDGEPYARPNENVRGRHVYVVQSLYSLPGEKETMEQKLVKLSLFCDGADGASATDVTAVIPYLAFSRQDRKTESRAPLSARYLAKSLEASNIKRIMTMDVHNPAIQSAYRIQTDFLLPFKGFAKFIFEEENLYKKDKIAVVAPDAGAMDRAKALINNLGPYFNKNPIEIITGYADKQRKSGSEIVSYNLILTGDLDGALTIIPDDETVTGSTMLNIAQKAKERGAGRAVTFVTHGKMTEEAAQKIQESEFIDRFFITDTIHHPSEFFDQNPKFGVFSVAPIFRKAIILNHEKQSLSKELF